MKNLLFLDRRGVTFYCLFLGISTGLSGCCAFMCALDPLCDVPILVECEDLQNKKEKRLLPIPDSTQFDTGTSSETTTNDFRETANDSLVEKVDRAPSETQESLASNANRLAVIEELEQNSNPSIPVVHLGIGPSFLGGEKVDGEKSKPLPGFEIGTRWNLPIANQLAFTPGIQYRTIGNKNIDEYEVNDYYYYHVYRFEETIRLNYFDMQPFLSYKISPVFSLIGGPSLSFLAGAKRTSKSEHSSQKERSTNGFNSWNIGGNVQGYYQPLNSFFGFALSYNHGFSNILNTSEVYTPGGNDRRYSRSITLVVLYKLPQASNNYKRNRKGVASVMSPEQNRRRDAEIKRRYEEEKRNPRGTKRMKL